MGVLELPKESKSRVCLVVSAFKIQPGHCPLIEEATILEIFQKNHQPPRERITAGDPLHLSCLHPRVLDIAATLPYNPMDRRNTTVSVHFHHILAVFLKTISTLVYGFASLFQNTKSSFDLDVENLGSSVSTGREVLITEFGGYSFLTCYSENG